MDNGVVIHDEGSSVGGKGVVDELGGAREGVSEVIDLMQDSYNRCSIND